MRKANQKVFDMLMNHVRYICKADIECKEVSNFNCIIGFKYVKKQELSSGRRTSKENSEKARSGRK